MPILVIRSRAAWTPPAPRIRRRCRQQILEPPAFQVGKLCSSPTLDDRDRARPEIGGRVVNVTGHALRSVWSRSWDGKKGYTASVSDGRKPAVAVKRGYLISLKLHD